MCEHENPFSISPTGFSLCSHLNRQGHWSKNFNRTALIHPTCNLTPPRISLTACNIVENKIQLALCLESVVERHNERVLHILENVPLCLCVLSVLLFTNNLRRKEPPVNMCVVEYTARRVRIQKTMDSQTHIHTYTLSANIYSA